MRFCLLLALSLLSFQALAEESFRHEFFLGAYSGPQATATFYPGNQNSYGGATGYNYRFDSLRDWQLGADFYGNYSTYSGGNYTSISLLVGPTFNFSNDKGEIANSFFIFARYGFSYNSTSYSDQYSTFSQSYTSTLGTVEAGLGKRFQLTESVTYRPVIYGQMTAGSANVLWAIVPFSFGINL